MEYRNIIYYVIYFPSIIFLAGFPFYLGIGKSNIGIIFYVIYVLVLTYILSIIQKKYWLWLLKKRRNKMVELLLKKYNNAKLLEDNLHLNLKILNENILLKFDFSNYPPHRFSTPKNRLKVYLEKSEYSENDTKLKTISINNQDWLYENKTLKYFFINRSIENLVKNSEKEIRKLIEKSRLT
ncbi:hypothetical protein [Polaribacter sp. OB-PA-B3]